MDKEKKVVVAYTVFRNEDGSVDVKDAGLEGTTALSNEEIFRDIRDVSRLIKLKEAQDAAFIGSYNALTRFYQDLAEQQATPVEPETPKA